MAGPPAPAPTLLLVLGLLLTGCGGAASEGPVEVASEFSGRGVVFPVPEGWTVTESPQGRDLIRVAPEDADEEGEVLIYPDLLGTTGSPDASGRLLKRVLGQLRSGIRGEPDVDGPIEIRGAEQAHQLVFRGTPPGTEPADGAARSVTRLQILARGADNQVALFSYAAPVGRYDERLADLIRERAGLAVEEPTPTAPASPGAASPAPTG